MKSERAKIVTHELTPVEIELAIVEYVKRHDRSVKDASESSVIIVWDKETPVSEALYSAKVTLTVPMKSKAPVPA